MPAGPVFRITDIFARQKPLRLSAGLFSREAKRIKTESNVYPRNNWTLSERNQNESAGN
jgi:hypothetical protein